MTRAVEELGPVDVLVNAAGTDVPSPVASLQVEDWDRVLNVNLRATFLLAQAVWPHMIARGAGTIINVGSVAGRRSWPSAVAYCAAKFGLTGLTQVLNAEGRVHRIRACLLYPGAMDTNWGVFDPAQRPTHTPARASADALPAGTVAALISWIAAAPADVVLNEATITPFMERGWP